MKAYVICCNDSIEYVILNDKEKANLKMDKLEMEHRDKIKDFEKWDNYSTIYFWHVHEVNYE